VIWWPAHGFKAVGELEQITEPPPWLINGLLERTRNQNGHGRSTDDTAGYITEPGRNEFLSREAYRQRKKGATVEQIKAVLTALNEARCRPPSTKRKLRRSREARRVLNLILSRLMTSMRTCPRINTYLSRPVSYGPHQA